MEELVRSNRSRKDFLEPLPTVFPGLAELGAQLYRSSFLMIASAPNRGKSLLALALAIRAGVRTLYLSPDTDKTDMLYRAAAMVSGDTMDEVETAWLANEHGLYVDLLEFRGVSQSVRFVWDSPLTLGDVWDNVRAYGMVYGEWPSLIVVDNISDLYAADTDGENLRLACEYLKPLAHTTGASVVGLHHLDGQYDDGTTSPPLSALRHKLGKKPDQVWTLWGPPSKEVLHVNIVKNKRGPSDPSGGLRATLSIDYARALIT